MLLRWCDKDSEIFNTLCTLIWLFAHCPYKRLIIREYMTTSEAIYVVRETKKLVARKERMNQNLRKPVGSVRAQKHNNFPTIHYLASSLITESYTPNLTHSFHPSSHSTCC
nr:protein abnormal spindle-like [Bactrocera oleae]